MIAVFQVSMQQIKNWVRTSTYSKFTVLPIFNFKRDVGNNIKTESVFDKYNIKTSVNFSGTLRAIK